MGEEKKPVGAARWNQKGNEIFSKEALDKMRSPEKLDMTMSITTPIGWMGLISVAVMMLAVVIWSIFGSFTVKADGMGLIMDSSGLAKVCALSAGNMDEIYVHPGDTVKKGD